MSRSDIAVTVRSLGKSYAISHQTQAHSTLAETMLHRLRHPFERVERETFWALKNVSFDIARGDVVGIIGRNGAGKSTLLKILSRITEPTEGEVKLYGRVGSLLEVGTGFHPELTGRENIFLNGQILGMRRKEIEKQFDAIVDFSGCSQFLDTPVKRYSSGMYVRLAFAVAAHLQSEILVVDEVLAVGDAEFQKKCLGKMKDVAGSGRTVLFVSHHMQSVQVLCNRAMFLQAGTCVYTGNVDGAIERYCAGQSVAASLDLPERRPGSGDFRLTEVSTHKETYTCEEEKRVRFRIARKRPYAGKLFMGCLIKNAMGTTVLHLDSRMVEYWMEPDDDIRGEFVLRSPWLKPGDYTVDLHLCSAGIIDLVERACIIRVIPLLPYPSTANEEATAQGVVFSDYAFEDRREDSHMALPRPAERQPA